LAGSTLISKRSSSYINKRILAKPGNLVVFEVHTLKHKKNVTIEKKIITQTNYSLKGASHFFETAKCFSNKKNHFFL
jgi:hypothetical protein